MKAAVITLLIVVLALVGYIGHLKGWWDKTPSEVAKELSKPSRPEGTYKLVTKGLYKSFRFEGKTTVTIVDAIMGMTFPSSYVLDGDVIRIRTDQSDLLLRYKGDTLIGEGFAVGIYVRQNKE